MKLVWAAAVLMIVLVVTGILLEQAMMSGSDHVLQLLHRVEAAVLAGRFDEAEALLSEVEQEWARAGRFWCMFVYHHDMDRVGDSLIRLRQRCSVSRLTAVAGGDQCLNAANRSHTKRSRLVSSLSCEAARSQG